MSLNNTIQIQHSNLSKAQQNLGKKALADSAQAAGVTDFQHLFANALGARATPDAKFSTIQEELQEAMGKNKKASSDTESTSPTSDPYGMAGAGSLAQANIWAQRNWSDNQSGGGSGQRDSIEGAYSSRPSETTQTEDTQAEAASVDEAAQSADQADATAKPSQNTSGEPSKAADRTAEPTAGTATSDIASTADASSAATQTVMDNAAAPTASTDAASTRAEDLSARFDPRGERAPTETAPQNLKGDGPLRTADTLTAGNATQALNTNNATAAAQRPEQGLSLAQQALQGQQQAGVATSTRSLKAGDEILATAGTSASSAGSSSAATPAGIGLASMATGRTGLAAEATIKTPVNQPGFVKELGAQVQWAVGKNLSTVDIRLNPTDMGGMNLRIVQRGQDIQLMIRTQDETAGALMTQHIAGLKETLAQNGLNLSQVQVQTSPNTPGGNPSAFQQQGQQTEAQSGHGSNGQGTGQGGQPSGQSSSQNNSQATGVDSDAPRRVRSNGNIDLIA